MQLLSALSGHPIERMSSNLAGVLRAADPLTSARFVLAVASTALRILRARNLEPADERMRGRKVSFTVDGTRVILDGADFSGAREMYCRRVYFAHPRVRLLPGTTVLDLGSNIGLFTTLAARRGCRVVAIEAQRGFLVEARRRLQKNDCLDNAELICGLAGPGKGKFATARDVADGTHHKATDLVEDISLPELIEHRAIGQIGFMKVDIEGSEFALFERYEPWMSQISCLAMEVHGPYGDPLRLQTVLRDAGLTTELRDSALRPLTKPLGMGVGYLFGWRDKL